jgi:hypothetical protein
MYIMPNILATKRGTAMGDEARVARLIAVFGDLPNDDKDLVLRISEAIKQEVQPGGPEGGGVVNGGRPEGGAPKQSVQDYNITMKQSGADLKETQSYFNIGLMVKYPFSINDSLSVFPLLGFDFQIFTKFKDTQGGISIEIERSEFFSYGLDEDYFNRTVFNVGLGLDISISKGLFFRGVFVYGINFHMKQQEDAIDIIEDAGYSVSVLNHGPSIKLALGYKF